ncbi:response regulator SirA [Sulfolobus sp. S-194]|uniref:sulfurtransferase TusA family protein n=1 Tax=Sulfolobus sp. S-194 TaxID=2512240 RepID=UPI0014370345|nr:sulfurtransferase TusA family protein [Sulfolobus sp. S-194]QIW23479.1 response regulator SirA [Sulfolobus sp. S-194]
MSQLKIYKELDLTSSSCAGPIGELSGVLEEIKEGEAIKVILGDEATKKDVEAFVKKKGYKIVQSTQDGKNFVLLITR